MILRLPDIVTLFDTEAGRINSLIIEDPTCFRSVVQDIAEQCEGHSGYSILSQDDAPLSFSRSVELISTFIPFDLNRKSLLTKMAEKLTEAAGSPQYQLKSLKIIEDLIAYLYQISSSFISDFGFEKVNIQQLIKNSGITFYNDFRSIPEQLCHYMDAVREFDREKLFVFVHLRCYITDEEFQLFTKTIRGHHYHVLFIESFEKPLVDKEHRVVIDRDLAEIIIQ